MEADRPGGRIIVASWVSNVLFALGSIPTLIGVEAGDAISAGVCLALFAVSLLVWVWAFAIAASRSSDGDDIAVASLFLVQGRVEGTARAPLYASFGLSLIITAITTVSNPFAVLVPMLSLGFVGLWGARHASFGRRTDVRIETRPLRPTRPMGQRRGLERGADGRARQ